MRSNDLLNAPCLINDSLVRAEKFASLEESRSLKKDSVANRALPRAAVSSLSRETLGIDLDRTRRERLGGALGSTRRSVSRAAHTTRVAPTHGDGTHTAGYTGSVNTNRKVASAAVGGLAVTDKD